MTNSKILDIAKQDRINLLSSKAKIGFIKSFSVDMVIKFLILLINSVGLRNKADFLYIDEIKNNSMIDNLYLTKEDLKKENSFVLKFHALGSNDHVKIGITSALGLILLFFSQIIVVTPLILFGSKIFTKLMLSILYYNFNFYLRFLPVNPNCKVIAMTDHHFFSAIIILKLKGKLKSFILQHGAIVYLDYYLPVYADYFLAWGIGSKEKMGNLENILVTGTYKFSKLNVPKYNTQENGLKVLWPLRPLPDSILKQYFSTIVTALSKLEVSVEIIIKKHPSSMSNFGFLGDLSTPDNFCYQVVNKTLEQIGKIDFAIIDNSTIGYDLFIANIPFLTLENLMQGESEINYKQYGVGSLDLTIEGVPFNDRLEYLMNYKTNFQFNRQAFFERELNNNKCEIKEKLTNL